jgi:type VI secretion system protein ImpL
LARSNALRFSTRRASATLAYSRLKLSYGEPDHPSLRLDQEVQGLDSVLQRRSGRKFAEPIPAIYTKKGFLDVSDKGGAQIAKSLQEDAWVFGDTGLAQSFDDRLTRDVISLYERDYIANWDALPAVEGQAISVRRNRRRKPRRPGRRQQRSRCC